MLIEAGRSIKSRLIGRVLDTDVVGCDSDKAPGARIVCLGGPGILGVVEMVGLQLRYLGTCRVVSWRRACRSPNDASHEWVGNTHGTRASRIGTQILLGVDDSKSG
ncbi:hypothetical protein IG631_08631 [Alternaria alternata]|nr:hypothetical protein IG631_08631 [Alternaria alternata]